MTAMDDKAGILLSVGLLIFSLVLIAVGVIIRRRSKDDKPDS
jgi:hypothetical protein